MGHSGLNKASNSERNEFFVSNEIFACTCELIKTSIKRVAQFFKEHGDDDDEEDEDANGVKFTSDPDKLQGTLHKVPIEKSPLGFGFTIVGGDEPDEFLQIKSVVPEGAAASTGNIQPGGFSSFSFQVLLIA